MNAYLDSTLQDMRATTQRISTLGGRINGSRRADAPFRVLVVATDVVDRAIIRDSLGLASVDECDGLHEGMNRIASGFYHAAVFDMPLNDATQLEIEEAAVRTGRTIPVVLFAQSNGVVACLKSQYPWLEVHRKNRQNLASVARMLASGATAHWRRTLHAVCA